MIVALRILHFLAFSVGVGGGIANAIVGARVTKLSPELGAPTQKLIGRISFVGLIVLWLTGALLVTSLHNFSGLGFWFWAKMSAVFVLTAAAITAQVSMLSPGAGTPRRLKRLGVLMNIAAVLAVVFAILSFS